MPWFGTVRRGLSNSKFPDLVTALVETKADGSLRVEFIGDPPQPKGDSGHSDIDSLAAGVLDTVRDAYQPLLGEATMGFQFAWYPWKESKKGPRLEGVKDSFLMFEVRQVPGGYRASLADDPSLAVSVTLLRDLPTALEAKAMERWPVLQTTSIPGMIHWNRNLSATGFSDVATPEQEPPP
jgi:hypothetical protein